MQLIIRHGKDKHADYIKQNTVCRTTIYVNDHIDTVMGQTNRD